MFGGGQWVVQGHIDEKQCCIFPADEGAYAGVDDGMPVSENL